MFFILFRSSIVTKIVWPLRSYFVCSRVMQQKQNIRLVTVVAKAVIIMTIHSNGKESTSRRSAFHYVKFHVIPCAD